MSHQFTKKLREFIERGGDLALHNVVQTSAKTDYYSIRGDTAKLSGLLDGYGPPADDWPDRLALYRLYHALELWDWFASIGDTAALPGITEDIRQLAGLRPSPTACSLVGLPVGAVHELDAIDVFSPRKVAGVEFTGPGNGTPAESTQPAQLTRD